MRVNRVWMLLLPVTLLVAGLAVPASPAAVTDARPGVAVRPTDPIAGEAVRVRVTLPTAVRRRAVLQRRVAGRWQRWAAARSNRRGVVRFSVRPTASTQRVRVRAPAVRVTRRSGAGRTTRVRLRAWQRRVRLPLAAQSATWQASNADGNLSVSGRFAPARSGRPVALERRVGATWTTVATTTQDARGRVSLTALPWTFGIDPVDLRLTALPGRTRAHAHSTAVRRVAAPDVALLVTASEPDAEGLTTLTAAPRGPVDTVRFFVDGRRVGEATRPPWQQSVMLSPGEHDVVAVALNARDAVVSSATMVSGPPRSAIDDDTGLVDGFQVDPVASDLSLPTTFATAPDGAVYVAEKNGLIKVIRPSEDGWEQPAEVADLTDLVLVNHDRGLMGLALDPDFATNGHLYVSYIYDDGRREPNGEEPMLQAQQVARYTVGANGLVDPASRHVVLGGVTGEACYLPANLTTPDCVPLAAMGHTIGDLAFDPDGNLLVGVGDGAWGWGLAGRTDALRAQDPQIMAGKVLRIDPTTGLGVAGNPHYGGPLDDAGAPGTSNASRMLAQGFRNPFRLTVREHDGLLVVGDVGEDRYEELNVVEPGGNYGWPCLEGPDRLHDADDLPPAWESCRDVWADDDLVAPAYAYPHRNTGGVLGGGSITGGVFYDGDHYPESFQDRYFFGDYAQNFLRTARVDHDGSVEDVDDLAYSTAAAGPVKLGIGPDGRVWFLSIYTGELRRLIYTEPSQQPSCAVGTFRQTFFDLGGPDSTFDGEWEQAWQAWDAAPLTTPLAAERCVDDVRLDELPADASPWPGEVDMTERYAVRWQGRIRSPGAWYRFTVRARDWGRLTINNEMHHNWFAFGAWIDPDHPWGVGSPNLHEVYLPAGLHNVRFEHLHRDGPASASLTWEQIGTPPTVALTAPANGVRVASGEPVEFTAVASTSTGSPPPTVEIVSDVMHMNDDVDFHFHPHLRMPGSSATLSFGDHHAPGQMMFRVRARATDAAGTSTWSAPVYVCLAGNDVGLCATS